MIDKAMTSWKRLKIEHLNLIAKKFGFMNIAEKILQDQGKAVIQ